MKIASLHVYPIKGCRGTALTEAILDAQGIRWDRRWMIVRAEDGRFLTQREFPQLARIIPTVDGQGMTIAFDQQTPLVVPDLPDDVLKRRTVTVWGFTGEARDCGEAAADWFSDILGFACRLVRTPDDFSRRVHPDYGRPEDRVGFPDGFPLLLASVASLDDLNARLLEQGAEPVPMDRFRPNIVITGSPAWAEDGWKTLTVVESGLTFRVAKPSARCAVTTVDQASGEKTGAEPLATLARFRRSSEGQVYFATNLIHDRFGPDVILRPGESLEGV